MIRVEGEILRASRGVVGDTLSELWEQNEGEDWPKLGERVLRLYTAGVVLHTASYCILMVDDGWRWRGATNTRHPARCTS